MWMEFKSILTVVGILFIAIVISQLILSNIFLTFFLFFGIFVYVLGDILIGYQISHNHLNILMDPSHPDFEPCVFCDTSGNIDFIKTKKGPLNTREAVKYKKPITIINKGDFQIRFINGNHGFIGHENYSENLNLEEVEALDKCEGDDIKDIVDRLPLEKIRKIENSGI